MNIIKPELLSLSSVELKMLHPFVLVFCGILGAVILSVSRVIKPKWPVFVLSVLICVGGILSSLDLIRYESHLLFNGMLILDPFTYFFAILFLACSAITCVASFRYLDKEELQHPEYYLLVLFSALGMMLMTASMSLIVLFIALELMSLSVYVLVGFRRADRRSNEAAMKYFILGSAASAVFLYGSALVYGATGSTRIQEVLSYLQSHGGGASPIYFLGVGLVVVGFLFKVAAVPFHMWMPDVYEGAPTPVTGFMTTGLKAAAFATFLRVLMNLGFAQGVASELQKHLHDIFWVGAVLTMVIGNVVALTQSNLKRMLAYSSIAHTGYLLMGLLVGPSNPDGYSSLVFYLVVYAIMNIGAFGIFAVLGDRNDSGLNLHDLAGLSQKNPWLAFILSVFLLSMAGIPPTAGFAAKYMLFYSAVKAGEVPLVIIGVLCSAISVYYYLRVIVSMYMKDPVGSVNGVRVPVMSGLVLVVLAGLVLQIGILPSKAIEAAKRAIGTQGVLKSFDHS